MEERFYTTQEVAEKLSVHEETVRRWIKSGKLKAERFGRAWRIRESDLYGRKE